MKNTDYFEFESFEEANDLYTLEVNGVPIWERMRHNVWNRINNRKSTSQEDITTKVRALAALCKSSIRRNPFFSDTHSIVVFGTGRRELESDGLKWDIYFDPIYDSCDIDYMHLEPPILGSTDHPIKTGNYRSLAPIEYAGEIQRRLSIRQPDIPPKIENQLDKAAADLEQRFDKHVDLKQLAYNKIYERKTTLPLYERVLEIINPELVLLECSYGRETMVEACKNTLTTVVELQHGIIHEHHYGYSFKGFRSKSMFPDYLLVWGDHWKNSADFPISEDRVISVGFPYHEVQKDEFNKTRGGDILFISQKSIGEELSQIAVDFEKISESERDIIYKLHPKEYQNWRDDYPWLSNSSIRVVDADGPSLYQLFSQSDIQIGVYSTALYEGLSFDLDTYIYRCDGFDMVDDIIKNDKSNLFDTADELRSIIQSGNESTSEAKYFKENPRENVCQVIQNLSNNC